jgi:hypothetical protein
MVSEGQMIGFKVNGKEQAFGGDPGMALSCYSRAVADKRVRELLLSNDKTGVTG